MAVRDLIELSRQAVRWTSLHGVIRFYASRAAKRGDPQATLISSAAARRDPLPIYDQVRARGELVKTRVAHMTVDHAVGFELLRSDDMGVTSLGNAAPDFVRRITEATRGSHLHPVEPPSLLSVEPPDHTRYRSLVSSVFTARAVNGLRDMVQATADALLDEMTEDARAGRPVDLIERYCAQLPVTVICQILGVPDAERDKVLRFGELAAPALDIGLPWRAFRRVENGLAEFDAWLEQHLEGLRRNPGEDLLSQLVHATQDGRGLDDREIRSTAGLVLAAGFETTVNLLGNGTALLARNPDQLAKLTQDPSRWSTAVEEALRLESPVAMTARVATRDTEVAGTRLPEGSLVVIALAGANRDPKVFTDPERFDVERRNAGKHLSFSGGRHFCLGAALARQEGEVGLRSLFERFPDLQVEPGGVRRPTRVLRGWKSLPVQLGAPATVGV